MKEQYFQWLIGKIGRKLSRSRMKLLRLLHDTQFTCVLEMDLNREDDGTELRYRFAEETGIYMPAVIEIDTRPCSVLEMMVALALRMETIMSDPDKGDRTEDWFREMLKSLGLYHMTDAHFNERSADVILSTFMKNAYEKNGNGGLFTLYGTLRDLRQVDIWTQAMWYLTEIYYGRDADVV